MAMSLLVAALGACREGAVDTFNAKDPVACPICSITAVEIGSAFEAIESAERLTDGEIAMDGRGHVYLVADWRRWQVDVFDSTGRHVKTLDKRGAGPGEFRGIRGLVVGDGDTTSVIDQSNGRRVYLSPSSLEEVRTAKWYGTPVAGLSRLSPGRLVGANWLQSHSPLSRAIIVFDDSGQKVMMVDGGPDSTRPRSGMEWARWVTPDGSGGFFSAHMGEYVIDKWSADGRLLGSRRIPSSWMAGTSESSDPKAFELGGSPIVKGIVRDTSGLLWVLGRIRDRKWRKGLGTRKDESGREVQFPDDWNQYDDSVIEVIDPETGAVVARQRFNAAFFRFARPGYVVSASDEPTPRFILWRLELHR
jgi:hypothetical protein